MSNQVTARFHCDKVADCQNQWTQEEYKYKQIEMTPVNGDKPEDQVFAVSSPGGELKLTIASQASDFVKGFFKAGKRYNLTFEEVEEDNGL